MFYHVLGNVLGAADTAANKTDKSLWLSGAYILVRKTGKMEWTNKYIL